MKSILSKSLLVNCKFIYDSTLTYMIKLKIEFLKFALNAKKKGTNTDENFLQHGVQGWQLNNPLIGGFYWFFKCNKTCLHPGSQDLQNSSSTQVKLSISCMITSPMYRFLCS